MEGGSQGAGAGVTKAEGPAVERRAHPWPAEIAPRVVGLVGWPATYSLSPAMHNAAFQACGLNWVYTLFPVPPQAIREAVAGLRALGLAGANVTVPHKQAVAALVDRLSPEAAETGAVNTLVVEEGQLVGHNTDVQGLLWALREAGVELAHRRVLVLGAGGAAGATVAACLRQGAAGVTVAARRPEQAQALVERFRSLRGGCRLMAVELSPPAVASALAECDVVVNATPLGTQGEGGEALVELADPRCLPPHGVAVDLVYRPPSTPWVTAARRAGRKALGGAGMLLYQGALAFERWTGLAAPVPAMRRALEQALGAEAFACGDTRPGPEA